MGPAMPLPAEHCIQDSIDGDNDGDERERSVIGSLRFMFIASNNLGEVHHAAGNEAEYEMCLQQLLSAMVECEAVTSLLDAEEVDGIARTFPVSSLLEQEETIVQFRL